MLWLMSVATMLAIAASVWGGSPAAKPPCGPIKLQWQEVVLATPGVYGYQPGAVLAEVAWPSTCTITMSLSNWRAQRRVYRCDDLVHAVGHLFLRDVTHNHPGMRKFHKFRACRGYR
jgi:hypothetical protein